MNATEQVILFVLGCISLFIGICLIAWVAVQKRVRAGVGPQAISGVLRALAKVVNAFAKYFPDTAARYGWALVVVGLVLIFLPFYLPSGATHGPLLSDDKSPTWWKSMQGSIVDQRFRFKQRTDYDFERTLDLTCEI